MEIQYEPIYDSFNYGLFFRPIKTVTATPNTDYIICAETGSTGAGFRRIMAYKFEKFQNKFTKLGSILI
jgi:hypothetical protein